MIVSLDNLIYFFILRLVYNMMHISELLIPGFKATVLLKLNVFIIIQSTVVA